MLSGGPSSALGPGSPARLPPFVSCGRFSFVRTPFFCRLLVRFSRPGGLVIRPEPEIIFTFVQTKRSMKVLYTALLALLLFPSCRRQSGDIDSFLHNAESLMNEHPEDALSIIRHIDRRKIYSSASEARYALLYSQALELRGCDQRFADGCRRELLRPSRHEARTGDGPLLSGPGLLQRREFRCRHPFLLPCRGCRFRHRRLLSVGIDQQCCRKFAF